MPRPCDTGAEAVAPDRPRSRARVAGIDLARGVALLGMFAVHVFDERLPDGSPTAAHEYLAGRALATFVLVAGISLTFIAGSRDTGRSWSRPAVASGLAARALVIAALGLTLNYADPPAEVILPYYGWFFLLAIPLLFLGVRALTAIIAALVVVAPLVVLASFDTGLPSLSAPTLSDLFTPFALATTILVTGSYPAVEYLALICAGLAIGRLDLMSRRVAVGLLAGGVALAAAAWWVSSVLMFHLGGLEQLRDAAPSRLSGAAAEDYVMWTPRPTSSWWWLAERAPYTTTPLSMIHVIGVGMAVVGAALLLARMRLTARALWPVAAAGSMSLTLYCAHLLVLASGWMSDTSQQAALYLALVVGALLFAAIWRRAGRQGPLERMVAAAAAWAREMVDDESPTRRATG
jgi:uncharacterized membrane protein YeiB